MPGRCEAKSVPDGLVEVMSITGGEAVISVSQEITMTRRTFIYRYTVLFMIVFL